jgi:hypothetical protein
VIFFPFDPSVPSSPRSGLPISYATAHRKLLNLEIIHIKLFFFKMRGNSTFQKVYFVGPSKWVKLWLSQALTTGTRLNSNSRSLCRSQALCHHATPLEDIHIKYIINWQVNLRFI